MITYEDFKKIDLRVAAVKSVEPHPNADKLMILKVDLGDEERQLVAGIKQWYEPEQLVGKNIVIVANLEPAELRGTKSNGMLLAAQAGDDVVVLTTDKDIAAGAKVH